MTRMSEIMPAQDHSAFDGRMKARTVIGAVVAAMFIISAAVVSHSVPPAQAATSHRTGAPELRGLERNPQRSGALSGYQILF